MPALTVSLLRAITLVIPHRGVAPCVGGGDGGRDAGGDGGGGGGGASGRQGGGGVAAWPGAFTAGGGSCILCLDVTDDCAGGACWLLKEPGADDDADDGVTGAAPERLRWNTCALAACSRSRGTVPNSL